MAKKEVAQRKSNEFFHKFLHRKLIVQNKTLEIRSIHISKANDIRFSRFLAKYL